ncbi:MAG: Spy/CpxP family protein refolding chaperone [Hylemonella sp.]
MKNTLLLVACSLFLSSAGLMAQTPPPNSNAPPSWMERWFGSGHGMMGPYQGYRQGPGWEGYGRPDRDWGPMGPMMGYGGHGMMGFGGQGMMGFGGQGMMGYGGHDMMGMGGHAFRMLDLNDQQRSKLAQIHDELRKKNWETMGKLLDEQAMLRDLFHAEKRDPAAIGRQSMKIAELRRQLLESSVDAHNRIEAILSKEQKERLRRLGRGWMMGAE